LNSVSLFGSASGSYSGVCTSPLGGCSAIASVGVTIPGLGIDDSFDAPFLTGPDPGSDSFAVADSITIAPDFAPLAFFESFAPIPGPVGAITVGILPDPFLTGTASLDYDLSIVYDFEPVPEPATTAGLLIAGGLGILAKRRKTTAASDEENS
ncbi:MAG: PEP-CTERM sorting domain-containing protein, partial [Cyanobacteria bacterium J06648_11]